MKFVNLETDISEITFKNPVIAASGTFGFGREYEEFIDLNLLGGISVKGLTLEKRIGNKPPRIAETYGGILNSVGLQNPGVKYFVENEIPFLRKYDTKIIANVAGSTLDDYCSIVEYISRYDIDAIELNVSCPNVEKGCLAFGSTPEGVYEVTKEVLKYSKLPLMVKLSPNVLDIKEVAIAAEEAGANAITLINTILGMSIDIYSKKTVLNNNYGGLSGPAIKPIALRMVHQVSTSVSIPVIGMGGIINWKDAIEFILAGASAVMVGTANFQNPLATIEIIKGIEEFMKKYGYNNLSELIGKVELNNYK